MSATTHTTRTPEILLADLQQARAVMLDPLDLAALIRLGLDGGPQKAD